MIGPKEKKERALGERLGLKGERCSSPKCAAVRKPYKPGMHGQSRRRKTLSEYGLQLKEKQKFKVVYGVDDRNLWQIFGRAKKAKGSSAVKILEFLERRLDNVVWRLGFASSRGAARQLVNHGHVYVNGRRVRSPGFQVKNNDIIKVEQAIAAVENRKNVLKKFEPPQWLYLDREKLEGKVLSSPAAESPFDINLLVESFSK
jgi:small subunit ribosomal protein S4